MFKTILKTLALSATTLTLLSACGASDALNAAIRTYELNQQSGAGTNGYLSVGSGKEDGDSEDDEEYLPAVLAQTDERFLPSQSAEFAEIEIVREELVADDTGLAEFEEQRIAELADPEESRLIEEQPTAEESRPIEEQPIGELADPEESRHIEEQPIVIAEDARLAEIEKEIEKQRIAEEARLAEIEKQRIAEEARLAEIEKQRPSHSENTRLGILAEEQRIKDELKADPSAFNTTSSRVSSIRFTGTHNGDGSTPYSGDNTYDITRSKTQDTVGISRDEGEDPALILTINGVGHNVVPYTEAIGFTGGKVTIYYNEENISTYFIGDADIRKIIRGTHATIQGAYIKYSTDTADYGPSQSLVSVDYTRGVATVGIQTPASVVAAQSAVATYNGNGSLFADLSSGGDYFGESLSLSITMSVDFDANTIAGTGWERRSPYEITFNSAPIVGNGFEGTFTLNNSARDHLDIIDNPTGQYGGNFFGPNADDLAGVMSFQGASRDSGVDIIGHGGFRADRQ